MSDRKSRYLAKPPDDSCGVKDFHFETLWKFGEWVDASAAAWKAVEKEIREVLSRENRSPIKKEWLRALARELWFAIANSESQAKDIIEARSSCAKALGDIQPLAQGKDETLAALLKQNAIPTCALYPLDTSGNGVQPPSLGQVWVLTTNGDGGSEPSSYRISAEGSESGTSWELSDYLARRAANRPKFARRLALHMLCSGTVTDGILGPVKLGNKLDLISPGNEPQRRIILPSSLKDQDEIRALAKEDPKKTSNIMWVDNLTSAEEDVSGDWEIRADNIRHHLDRAKDLLSHAGSLDQAGLILDRIQSYEEGKNSDQSMFANNPLLKAEYLKARNTLANHRGSEGDAEMVWKEFLSLEPELRKNENLECLKAIAVAKNDRAVSLIDRGDFQEAMDLLSPEISRRQKILECAGINKDAALAKMLGTSGQIYAIAPDPLHSFDDAERSFSEAIRLFADDRDVDRQYIYLGHLACDKGETGRNLWNEVAERIFPGGLQTPVTGKHTQYKLALQIKGLIVFGSKDDAESWFKAWDEAFNKFEENERKEHPFGLIYQAAAILAHKYGLFPEERMDWIAHSIRLMSREHSDILQRLAHIARIRRSQIEPESNGDSQQASTKDLIAKYNPLWLGYPPFATDEDINDPSDQSLHCIVDRALKQVRFNYW